MFWSLFLVSPYICRNHCSFFFCYHDIFYMKIYLRNIYIPLTFSVFVFFLGFQTNFLLLFAAVVKFCSLYLVQVSKFCNCPVGWGCRIHRLLLCRGVRPPPNTTSVLNITLNHLMELWGMWSTSSLSLLPGPLWPGVAASNRVLSMS